jgi:hypothetical protein
MVNLSIFIPNHKNSDYYRQQVGIRGTLEQIDHINDMLINAGINPESLYMELDSIERSIRGCIGEIGTQNKLHHFEQMSSVIDARKHEPAPTPEPEPDENPEHEPEPEPDENPEPEHETEPDENPEHEPESEQDETPEHKPEYNEVPEPDEEQVAGEDE